MVWLTILRDKSRRNLFNSDEKYHTVSTIDINNLIILAPLKKIARYAAHFFIRPGWARTSVPCRVTRHYDSKIQCFPYLNLPLVNPRINDGV